MSNDGFIFPLGAQIEMKTWDLNEDRIKISCKGNESAAGSKRLVWVRDPKDLLTLTVTLMQREHALSLDSYHISLV